MLSRPVIGNDDHNLLLASTQQPYWSDFRDGCIVLIVHSSVLAQMYANHKLYFWPPFVLTCVCCREAAADTLFLFLLRSAGIVRPEGTGVCGCCWGGCCGCCCCCCCWDGSCWAIWICCCCCDSCWSRVGSNTTVRPDVGTKTPPPEPAPGFSGLLMSSLCTEPGDAEHRTIC